MCIGPALFQQFTFPLMHIYTQIELQHHLCHELWRGMGTGHQRQTFVFTWRYRCSSTISVTATVKTGTRIIVQVFTLPGLCTRVLELTWVPIGGVSMMRLQAAQCNAS